MSDQDIAKAEKAVAEARKVSGLILLLFDYMESHHEAYVSRLFWRVTSFFVNPISTRQKFTILGHLKFFKISSLMWSITRRQHYPILDLLNLLKVRERRITDFMKELVILLNPKFFAGETDSN